MADDGTDWAEDEFPERPYGAKPYGAKPYGAKPYGAKPYGAKPYGAKPYGAKPYGAKPYGAKPYGAKPYGAKPYGAKPYEEVGRPGAADPTYWGDDICELVLSRSAVVTLGATVVSSDTEVSIPTGAPTVAFRAPGAAPASSPGAAQPEQLNPREWRLEAWMSVPNRVLRSLAATPELSFTLISDLADGLARGADSAFLTATKPVGIGARTALEESSGASGLERVRNVVKAVRETDPTPAFRQTGWILNQATLEQLTREPVDDTLDKERLLELDGADGGLLVGYPFVTSLGADARIYFAADWSDAFVGIGDPPVIIDTPAEPAVSGATVIRATMTLDFVLRREDGFAWAKLPGSG